LPGCSGGGGGGTYTDEEAQDAVGSILQNSASVTLVYDDPSNTITASVNSSLVQLTTEINQPNGYAGLDVNGQIPLFLLPPSILGAVNYVGTWDANANNPALVSGIGDQGDYYVVDTAGTTTLDGISNWAVGRLGNL
jgi:hypothetical protein